MKCRVCAGTLAKITTDLPFKLTDCTIVIIKQLPVLQCERCREYSFDNPTCAPVEEILAEVHSTAELEIIPFAA